MYDIDLVRLTESFASMRSEVLKINLVLTRCELGRVRVVHFAPHFFPRAVHEAAGEIKHWRVDRRSIRVWRADHLHCVVHVLAVHAKGKTIGISGQNVVGKALHRDPVRPDR